MLYVYMLCYITTSNFFTAITTAMNNRSSITASTNF